MKWANSTIRWLERDLDGTISSPAIILVESIDRNIQKLVNSFGLNLNSPTPPTPSDQSQILGSTKHVSMANIKSAPQVQPEGSQSALPPGYLHEDLDDFLTPLSRILDIHPVCETPSVKQETQYIPVRVSSKLGGNLQQISVSHL